jgi:hypothetical protein
MPTRRCVLLERYSHEFKSVRGGRGIEEDIAEMDAAYGGSHRA